MISSALSHHRNPDACDGGWTAHVLDRLDHLLGRAVRQIEESPSLALNGFPELPGLFISSREVDRLLRRPPETPRFAADGAALQSPILVDPHDPDWRELRRRFDLSEFDLDLIAVAIAVELDLKYQKIFAWLQDDMTRLRPTADLALNLLCTGPAERREKLAHFDADAPLLRYQLMSLVPDRHQVAPPRLATYLVPDPELVNQLLGNSVFDERLATFCRLVHPLLTLDEIPLPSATRRGLERTIRARQVAGGSLHLLLNGPEHCGQVECAAAIAAALNQPLMVVDLGDLSPDPGTSGTDLQAAVHHARIHDRVLAVAGWTGLTPQSHDRLLGQMLHALGTFPGVALLCGPFGQPVWRMDVIGNGDTIIEVDLPAIDHGMRAAWWRGSLDKAGVDLDADAVDFLVANYRLSPGSIACAAAAARRQADWHDTTADLPVVTAAVRRQTSSGLETMAAKRAPIWTWDDIVLPADQLAQLHEICDHARYRHVIQSEWREPGRHAAGGLNVLFSGSSGTGKTMAADVIAGALELDLATINIAYTVSKYIGETEKNLDRIFTAARESNVVLFFDEADAIFGKRSQVKDAHDRYANIEVGYLLQKIEGHDGIVILGTNLRSNMDEAFTRRLHHVVEFPFPDALHRLQIWRKHLRPPIPVADDVDLDFFARQFELAGGSIHSIVTNACGFAVASRQPVGMRHLLLATKREFQKLGRVWDEQSLGDSLALLATPGVNGVSS